MRALSTSLVGLLLIASLSGCFADEGGEGNEDNGDDTNEASEGAPAANETGNETGAPPTVDVMVSENGTALEAVDGVYAATAGVNLTFDASGSADADEGNLTFAWEFPDGVTGSEALVDYAFSAAGLYTVNLTVTDEDDMTASASLNVNVSAGGPAPGTPLAPLKKSFSGTYTVGVQGTSCVNNVQGVSPSGTHVIEIPAVDEAGVAVLATQFVIKLTGGTTTIDQAMELLDPKGKSIQNVDGGSTGPNGGEDMTADGDFEPGKYTLKVFGCVAVNGSYTAAVTVARVAA